MVLAAFFVAVLLLWFLPAAAVYVHAKNRNRDALLWAAVTLVGGLLGILLYLLFGDDTRISIGGGGDSVRCLDCNHENHPDSDYCSACGSPLKLVCADCGRRTLRGDQYCSACGADLSRASPPSS